MKNNQYWINRISENFLETEENSKKLIKEIQKHYKKAIKNINSELARLYAKFEGDNGVNLDEALKTLNISEMKEWKMSLKDYLLQIKNTGDESLLLELNTIAMQSRVTKLEALKQVINAESEILRYNIDTEVGRHLTEIVKKTHKNTLYGFFDEKLINKRDMIDISNEDIKDILKLKWHGANYSSRIWNNTKKLAEYSKNSVISALGSGRSYDNIVNDLRSEFEQNEKFQLMRVIRTESAFVHTQSEIKAFKDVDIEKYKISAHLDNRTSEKCTHENGKIYKVEEMQIGYNAPPFHPNCRSIIIPITEFDGDYVEYKNIEKVSEKEYNISVSGATITDGYSEKAIMHAELMYGAIRKRKTDVNKIAINTGYSKNIIQKIKDYLFISKHDLGGNFKRFDPDFYIAQSWDRLTKGTIEEHDLTLLKHEIMEKELIDKGFNQIEAHKITSKKYNYQKEAEEYYDKIEKSKKRK